jgi:ABC-type nitrate/sulfonate/bicarbonate transport system substrate-binding protein
MNDDPRMTDQRASSRLFGRRKFLKTTAGAVSLAALAPAAVIVSCGAAPTATVGPSASGKPKVISIAASRGTNSAAVWNLVTLGPKYGFDVQISELFTYADQQRAAQTGQTEFATTGVTNPASVLDAGTENLKVIAGQLWGGSNIVVRKGVKADSWKDLEGKTVGVTPGTYARIEFLIAAREKGVALEKLNIVNISSAATALEALQKANVDAVVLFSPTTDLAVLQDLAYYPDHIDIGDSTLGPANSLVFANTSFLADKTTATNFMKAYVESVKEMQNEDNFVRLGTLVAGLKPEVCRLAFKYMYFSEIIDEAAVTKATKLGVEFAFTKTDVSSKIAGIFDYGPLMAATGKTQKDLTTPPDAALKQVRR